MPLSQFASSFRLRHGQETSFFTDPSLTSVPPLLAQDASSNMFMFRATKDHTSHPDFPHLVLLVFEAVLEVVCVALPGYVVAYQGLFGAEAQKFLANLNVWIFTPCLVFSKLGSQLNADKLLDLIIIPAIYVIQTLISWLCSIIMSKLFRFGKRETNFVTAMAVFGNSNSLPISLVISLSKTLKGLHWDRIPGDNDEEVAARGILYLLIFQQLGQLLRWSWGYNVLLAPPEDRAIEEARSGDVSDDDDDETERERYKDTPNSDYESGQHSPQTISTFPSSSTLAAPDSGAKGQDDDTERTPLIAPTNGNATMEGQGNLMGHGSGNESTGETSAGKGSQVNSSKLVGRHPSVNHITQFPSYHEQSSSTDEAKPKTLGLAIKAHIKKLKVKTSAGVAKLGRKIFYSFPKPAQKGLSVTGSYTFRFCNAVWQSMNPPLWAMLIGVVVASVPQLQILFFSRGTFINNSVTRAIKQNGDVAVPLILVVLGANLARNTIPREQLAISPEARKAERNLLVAALISRMLLPTLIMAPVLALVAKYVPISILDDPIFIIVCFLLTGAPSALQLAQICQVNNVFTGTMSKLLFQSYVVWILPSTLALVMLALETVEWAVA